MRVRPTWVKFCSLVSQFVKVSLIILSCAELTSAPEPHLPAQAPASPTSRLSLLHHLCCTLWISSAHPKKALLAVGLAIPVFNKWESVGLLHCLSDLKH